MIVPLVWFAANRSPFASKARPNGSLRLGSVKVVPGPSAPAPVAANSVMLPRPALPPNKLATNRSPFASKARPSGSFTTAKVVPVPKVPGVAPAANSVMLLGTKKPPEPPPMLPTNRSPLASKAKPNGWLRLPAKSVEVAPNVPAPVEASSVMRLLPLPKFAMNRSPLASKARPVGPPGPPGSVVGVVLKVPGPVPAKRLMLPGLRLDTNMSWVWAWAMVGARAARPSAVSLKVRTPARLGEKRIAMILSECGP